MINEKPIEMKLASTLNSGQIMTYTFMTPDPPTKVHLMVLPTSNGDAMLEVIEESTLFSCTKAHDKSKAIQRRPQFLEWILKPNIWYTIKMDSQSNNNDCEIIIMWTNLEEDTPEEKT